MVYCYNCGRSNPEGAKFCNDCGGYLTMGNRFEASVDKFAEDTRRFAKDFGEKASEAARKLADEAQKVVDDVSRRVAPKPLPCPKCGKKIYETDAYCWGCGDKRS